MTRKPIPAVTIAVVKTAAVKAIKTTAMTKTLNVTPAGATVAG